MKTGSSGFTLIELIMIIVILAIAFVPLSSMILQGVKGSIDSDVSAKSLALATQKMEETKQLPFSSVSDSSGSFSSPFSDYSYSVSVSDVDEDFKTSSPGLYKKIDVMVQNTSGYTLKLTTVVSKHN